MGWIFMLSVGAILSGLFFGFRDLLPLLAAQRSGVIRRKGARDIKVSRDADPDVFARLLANRSKGAAGGFGLFMIGIVGLSLLGLAVAGVSGPLAGVIFVVYFGFAVFAGYCLINGFATGRMFAFWGLTLFGEASLKGNPVWFWIYAAINLVIVLGAALSLLGALTR
jgi:hypothetical protein